jgi:hypothetical protein
MKRGGQESQRSEEAEVRGVEHLGLSFVFGGQQCGEMSRIILPRILYKHSVRTAQ